MDAEQVVDKILKQANDQAEKIISQAEKNADAETDALQDQLDQFTSETENVARKAAQDQEARMLAAARMENRKALLATKVQLLDEVFKQAAEKIKALPDEQYQQLMANLMQKAVETGDEQVLVGQNETRIDDKLVKGLNRQLGPGFKGNLQLASERANIDAGFVLRRGNVNINVSVEVLIAQAREQLEMQFAGELFS